MLARVFGLCALCLALGAVALQAQDVFVLPGVGTTSASVSVFATSPLSEINTFSAGEGSFLVLPNLAATTYYVIANSTTQTITSTDATFLSPVPVASLPNPATAAVITPDGKLLAVAASTLHLFSTSTNTEVVSGGLSQGSDITTFDVASSLDASRLFALGSTTAGGSQLTAYNTATLAVTGNLAIPQAATAVAVGPNGLVYVSVADEILEINPATLQPTVGGTIAVSGIPGRMIFTPDGQYAIAPNQATISNSSLFVVTLASHGVAAPNLGLPPILSLRAIGVNGGADTLVAMAGQGIYQIALGSTITIAPFGVSGLPSSVHAFAVSNEVPSGALATVKNLYVDAGSDMYQISLATNNPVGEYPLGGAASGGVLDFAAPTLTPTQSVATSLITYGTNQTILPSGTTTPLVVQVLDANNHPLMGEQIKFQTSASGATLSAATVTTAANGYALTYLTAPATAGPVTVTATLAALTANFNITVSTSAGGATAPQLTIVAGQGQLMASETDTQLGPGYGSPLEVLVTASNGSPLVDVPVTFTVPASDGSVVISGGLGPTETAYTNSDGIAEVNFLTTSLPTSNSTGFNQTEVTATYTGASPVTFFITTVSEVPGATVRPLAPSPGATLTGAEGTTLPGAIAVQVTSGGYGIPNVSLTLNDGNLDPTQYPSATCAPANGGFILTNNQGMASCDIVFGPRVGSGTLTALVGYTHPLGSIGFKVTPGAAGDVQIVQGNNQTGTPGQPLPLALLVHVTDSGGNTVSGAAVNWQVVTAGAVTLSNVVSVTDSNGNASALATLGNIGGVAQVTATSGTASATFSLTVNIPSAGLLKLSGDQQTAQLNMAFPLPLTVAVVNSSGSGLPGAQVNFQVTSGTATLGSSSAITNSAGQASTTVTAGGTPGPITVTATSAGFTATFTLTALPIGPSNITIVNGASFNANTGISPGGIATISGTGILSGITGVVSAANSAGQLPTTFAGVTITFNGTPAPIYYVEDTNGSDQISVQVPFETPPGNNVPLTVSVANVGSSTVPVQVKALAPGVFTSVYAGKTYAVAVRPDGSQVSPTNPAQRGEDIQFYVTGLGQALPTIATGAPGVPDQAIVVSMIVGLDNGGVPLISSVYGPGLIGIYVVTIQVPLDIAPGPYQPVGIIAVDPANNLYYAQPTYIPIQ
jgi:uncharacterized protein (TIGR03437 family)